MLLLNNGKISNFNYHVKLSLLEVKLIIILIVIKLTIIKKQQLLIQLFLKLIMKNKFKINMKNVLIYYLKILMVIVLNQI